MDFIVSQLMTGLSIASILLLIALGLAVIYGVTGVINLAHGEFVMLGAYSAWALQHHAGVSLIPALVPVFMTVAALGYLIEASVIRHLYHRPLDTILATWGIGIIAQQLIRHAFGTDLKNVEMPEVLSGSVSVLGVTESAYRVFVLAVALGLFALTWHIYRRTPFGLKLRAITQNRDIAASFGINAAIVYRMTFAFGAGLAGVAGALVAPLKSVSPEMGTAYVVDAFMVVVLGGVQSLFGTAVSAGLLGEMSAGIAYLQNDTIAKVVVLIFVVIVIRFRPQGLFSLQTRS